MQAVQPDQRWQPDEHQDGHAGQSDDNEVALPRPRLPNFGGDAGQHAMGEGVAQDVADARAWWSGQRAHS